MTTIASKVFFVKKYGLKNIVSLSVLEIFDVKEMGFTTYQVFLTVLLVVTGSINTIITKWCDRVSAVGQDGKEKKFNHPIVQTLLMFLGELMCFIVFKILYFTYRSKGDGKEDASGLTKGNRDFNQLIMLLPALCDMTATAIMLVALNLTYASSYQMFRGSLIIFVGILSVTFLHRKIILMKWIGIVLILVGLAIVGVADFLLKGTGKSYDKNLIITGDVLIVISQLFHATQNILEEKFLSEQDIPPLQVVGWEGIFGFTTVSILLIPFYFIRAGPPITEESGVQIENAIDAFIQIGNSWKLLVGNIVLLISIAFLNFAGISVTKEMSATTKVVLDTIRTMIIWAFSLLFFEEHFHWLQLIGFFILIIGMFLYNDITCASTFARIKSAFSKEQSPDDEVNTNAQAPSN